MDSIVLDKPGFKRGRHSCSSLSATCPLCRRRVRFALLRWNSTPRSFVWRQPDVSPFFLLVAEILLQRTTATQVNRTILDLVGRYPGWAELQAGDDAELLALLQPLGLYRRRADVL